MLNVNWKERTVPPVGFRAAPHLLPSTPINSPYILICKSTAVVVCCWLGLSMLVTSPPSSLRISDIFMMFELSPPSPADFPRCCKLRKLQVSTRGRCSAAQHLQQIYFTVKTPAQSFDDATAFACTSLSRRGNSGCPRGVQGRGQCRQQRLRCGNVSRDLPPLHTDASG